MYCLFLLFLSIAAKVFWFFSFTTSLIPNHFPWNVVFLMTFFSTLPLRQLLELIYAWVKAYRFAFKKGKQNSAAPDDSNRIVPIELTAVLLCKRCRVHQGSPHCTSHSGRLVVRNTTSPGKERQHVPSLDLWHIILTSFAVFQIWLLVVIFLDDSVLLIWMK